MKWSVSAAGALLALLTLGCQSPPPPAPQPVASSPVADPARRARQAMERRDWRAAAPLLREAILGDANNVSFHYGLAVCASNLDAWEEATREFRWVLTHAPSGSQEYQVARTWLAEAGAPVRSAANSPSRMESASERKPEVRRTGNSGLYGQIIWNEPGENPVPPRMQVFLRGLPNSPTEGQSYVVRADDEGRYEFKAVVAGPYKVTNRIAGQPIWRFRTELEPGRDSQLDLTPQNSVKYRDDFADAR